MPSDNPHYPKHGPTKVILNYDKKTGAITDRFGTLICTWEELNSFPPALPEPLTAAKIINILNRAKTY